jgi:hypothetical protein
MDMTESLGLIGQAMKGMIEAGKQVALKEYDKEFESDIKECKDSLTSALENLQESVRCSNPDLEDVETYCEEFLGAKKDFDSYTNDKIKIAKSFDLVKEHLERKEPNGTKNKKK